MRQTRTYLALTFALLFPLFATAEYYVVPEDLQLMRDADAIAIVTVSGMHSAFISERDIVTNIDLVPEQVLKGRIALNETLRIVEDGGVVGSQIMLVSATPTYWVKNRALVFLEQNEDGGWRTYGAALGKFDFVRDREGRELAVRWATEHDDHSLWTPEGKPHEERVRDAQRFVGFLQRVLNRAAPTGPRQRLQSLGAEETTSAEATTGTAGTASTTEEPDYFVENTTPVTQPFAWDPVTNATYPPSAYMTQPFRWNVFDNGGAVTFRISGSQPNYDSVGAAQRALAAWTNDPGSNVQYIYGGTTSALFNADGQNTIVYNSTTDVPAGAIAYARWYGGNEHTYKGESFYSITEGDVVVKSNLSVTQKVFDEAITHELGHTLGFRHSDQGTPSSTQAVMKSVLSGAYGATLGPWDIEAVRTVYEGTTTTAPPGVATNLVARATSTSSITITWTGGANATGYQLERKAGSGAYTLIASPTGTSYVDSGLTAGVTYVYRVRTTGPSGTTPSAYSNVDHATTIIFADDPLIPDVTPIRAIHLTQLRQAVNAVRAAAGLAGVTFTDPNPAGLRVRAVHITELRNALTPALAALGKAAAYTDPTLAPGMPVKAVHFQEIRNLTK